MFKAEFHPSINSSLRTTKSNIDIKINTDISMRVAVNNLKKNLNKHILEIEHEKMAIFGEDSVQYERRNEICYLDRTQQNYKKKKPLKSIKVIR